MMDLTPFLSYSVFGFFLMFALILMGSIWWSFRIVQRKGLPVRKSVSEFEILDVNRISNTPFEYAYTLSKNSRVIQVESEEALQDVINQGLPSIYYIKKGDSKEFVLFGSEKQDQLTIKEWQLNQLNKRIDQQKRNWINLLLIYVGLILLNIFMKSYSLNEVLIMSVNMIWVLFIFWLLPLFFLLYLRKIKTRKFEDLRA